MLSIHTVPYSTRNSIFIGRQQAVHIREVGERMTVNYSGIREVLEVEGGWGWRRGQISKCPVIIELGI